MIVSELEKEGQNIRRIYQRRLPSDNSKDYYFIHRNTGTTEPVLIEYGFLDSSKDDVNQLKKDYKNYSEAVVRAVLEYIGYEYEPALNLDIYVVKKGDTLWSIAKKYNLSVDELKNLNNLNSNLLGIGQTLKVSESPNNINDIYYVKNGDTLYGIASRYGITVDELKNYNNLNSNILNVGDKLYIPTGQIIENIVSPDYDTYIVKKGDTLYSIASKYNISVDKLRNINNLNSDILVVGQKLLVPIGEEIVDTILTNYIDYRINSGDTLYSIAKKYDIKVDDLKKINNLNSNNLSVGQVIKVPYFKTNVYTVEPGDTLYSIARKYNISISELKNKNNLNSDILSIGQVLKVS